VLFAKSRRTRWAWHVARIGAKAYRILVGNPEEKRLLGRPRCRWEDDIKANLERQYGVVWIGLMWVRIGTSGGLL
jgi:hypothetical protein